MGPRELKLNWNKVDNFLQSLSTSGKIIVSNVFQHENGGIHGIRAFWHFSSKTGHQKYSAWVTEDPFMYVRVKMTIYTVILEIFIKCLMLFRLPIYLTSIYIIVRFGR